MGVLFEENQVPPTGKRGRQTVVLVVCVCLCVWFEYSCCHFALATAPYESGFLLTGWDLKA